ncbi:MAG: hypothetical protein HY775_00955 [Acidobacteria bacterium]|nr:hypothetical protein [Acidobacteriota bacterium]
MSWRAGFGAGVITPPVPVFLAGFGDRTEPARSVHDDLQARALFLSAGERAVCLIVCDLLALSPEFADPVRSAVGEALGLAREEVLTACIHTHSGPNAVKGAEVLGWPSPDGYERVLVEGCLAAAVAARAAAEPAELRFVRAPLPGGLSVNRRELPYEPTFAALDVVRPGGGGRIGVLANVGIHPVALGPGWLEVSSDWVGPFRAELARLTGGSAIMLSSALGDVNPSERHTDLATHAAEAYDEASAIGAAVAVAVAAALPDGAPVEGSLEVGARVLSAPVGETPLVALLGAGPEISVEMVEWQIGSVRLVAVPGEPFHALGRAIEEARGGRALVAGLAPTWHGYLPVPYGGGYEETVSFGEPAVEAIARAAVAGCLAAGAAP